MATGSNPVTSYQEVYKMEEKKSERSRAKNESHENEKEKVWVAIYQGSGRVVLPVREVEPPVNDADWDTKSRFDSLDEAEREGLADEHIRYPDNHEYGVSNCPKCEEEEQLAIRQESKMIEQQEREISRLETDYTGEYRRGR